MVGLGSEDWLLRAVQCRFNLSYFILTLELFKYFVKIHKNHPSRAKLEIQTEQGHRGSHQHPFRGSRERRKRRGTVTSPPITGPSSYPQAAALFEAVPDEPGSPVMIIAENKAIV